MAANGNGDGNGLGSNGGNGNGADGALAVQIEKLEERLGRDEESNTKEHDEMNRRLDKVLEEAMKRWPPALAALVAILSSVCTGLITYLATHLGG